ncbi:hypothetical protein FQ330_05270 [Agrococcus sediminis]|uniref:Lipoprotein n=1 Tax=Agrococcus sediminis TaxID=2599924 RepID=A0A5M8QGM1_9MICO|nr:hypothetical protein [Agrococcus sediminis]KAA6435169.1 hypothetical protein FQ330_05270 [Agrococcus sediminis]
MSRTAVRALRASAAVLAALALAACAQPAAPAAPSSPAAEPAPTTAPTASATPEPSASAELWRAFESQDGAVRFAVPEGWSVDDRSAMGEASEMYDRGPGWLNELVVLDGDGAQMLWYREAYGTDFADCRPIYETPIKAPVDPYSPEARAVIEQSGGSAGPSFVLGELAEASTWSNDAAPGAWSTTMGMTTTIDPSHETCLDQTGVLWLGNRIAEVSVTADGAGAAGEPDTTIDFGSEQLARDWFAGEEAALLVDVLSSFEFTGAPVLEEAP